MSPFPAYQFYPTHRFCPSCRARLVTAEPFTAASLQGPLQRLGITCYCMQCNTRYRARSRLRYSRLAWAGPLGRWIWWQTAELEVTLTGEQQEVQEWPR